MDVRTTAAERAAAWVSIGDSLIGILLVVMLLFGLLMLLGALEALYDRGGRGRPLEHRVATARSAYKCGDIVAATERMETARREYRLSNGEFIRIATIAELSEFQIADCELQMVDLSSCRN